MVNIKDTGERLIPEKHTQSLTYGEHLVRYRAALGIVDDKIVLDIASGAGYGAALLADKAKKIIGMDFSNDAVKYAKSLYNKKNLEYIQGDAQKMPFKDSSFDVVVSLETIEHLPRPEEFVKEVIRVLKPDGIFYVSTPNDDEFTEGNEYHLHEFDFKELSRLINKYFAKKEYYYQGSWYSSGVLDADSFENPTKEIEAIKTFSQPLKKAIYFLAVSTNSKKSLPKLKENIVASDSYSELESIKISKSIEASIDLLKKDNSALRNEIDSIHGSKGWLYIDKFNKIKKSLLRKK